MKKFVSKIIGSLLGATLAIGIGVSIGSINSNKAAEVNAAVSSYSDRTQSTYYTSAFSHKVNSSQYGTTLLNTLHELMYDSHKSYNTYAELWTYTKETDYDIDNPNNIILLYSRQSVDGNENSNVWNREHVWCQSHAFYTTGTGAGSDLHHLRPASTNYNSTRSNTPYGVVASHSESNRMGDTDCYYTNNYFEPADYIKGDVARILMYMYTHYSSSVSGTSTYSGTLNITDIVTTSSGTAQAAWDLLMDWNELDPVDYQEMIRNNRCAYLLGNYNPYIDHPEFARMIWDDTSSQQAGLFFQTSYKTVNVGSTYTNTASKYGNVSSSGDITYTSDNPSVATVNSSGVVTGVSNGVARIKARCTINGVSKISYHFVVVGSGYTPKHTLNASGVVYTPTSKTTAVASETLGSESVTYNNTYGTSQLTKNNSLTLTINNFPKTISSFKLYMKSNGSAGSGTVSVTVGGSSYYSKTGTFAQIYGSYSTSFVPVDITNASASKKTGTIVINISATVNSLFFQKAVIDYSERTVTKATSISITPSSISLTPGEDNFLTTSFTPSNTTLQTVTWSSSNSSVATVNRFGLVRAIAKGSATITATAGDGNGATGTTTINVVDEVTPDDPPAGHPTVTSVTVSPSTLNLDLYNNLTGNLSATVNGTNSPAQTVNWTTGNSGVATVNSSGVVTAVGVGSTTITAQSTVDNSKTGQATINVTDSTPVASSISATVSKTYYVGDVITSSDITVTDNLDNSIDGFTFANNNYQFTYSDASSGGSLTNKTFTNSISYNNMTCSLTVQVQRKEYDSSTAVSDEITRELTGVGTSYTSWNNKTSNSDAVYAGHCMKYTTNNSDAIQLRSTMTNSTYYSGVVSTSSGGSLESIVISWNSGTSNGRTLSIYGKNSAYSTPNDLWSNDSATQGTLLGSIKKGTNTSLTITGSYTYIGIRSASGAMYIDSITINYAGGNNDAENLANFVMYEDTTNQCLTKLDDAIEIFEGLTSSERAKFMTNNGYVIFTARERLNAWATHEGKTITYKDGDYIVSSRAISPFNDIIKNESSITIVIIISLIGITAIGGYFFLRHKKEAE